VTSYVWPATTPVEGNVLMARLWAMAAATKAAPAKMDSKRMLAGGMGGGVGGLVGWLEGGGLGYYVDGLLMVLRRAKNVLVGESVLNAERASWDAVEEPGRSSRAWLG